MRARYKRDFDKRVRAVAHKPATGGYVYLDPYDGSKAKSKLQHIVEGPYRVLDVTDRTATVQRGGVAERVTLDRLTPAPINATEKASAPPPVAAELLPSPANLAEKNRSGPSYLVDKITDHRVTGPQSKRRYEFLVHWVGYADTTWEPRANIPEELVSRYFKSLGTSAAATRARLNANGGFTSHPHRRQ